MPSGIAPFFMGVGYNGLLDLAAFFQCYANNPQKIFMKGLILVSLS